MISHSDVIDQSRGSGVKADEKLYTWVKFHMYMWSLYDFKIKKKIRFMMTHSGVIGQSQGSEVKEDEKLYTWTKFHVRRWLLRNFSYAHAIFGLGPPTQKILKLCTTFFSPIRISYRTPL